MQRNKLFLTRSNLLLLSAAVLLCVACKPKPPAARNPTALGRAASARDTAEMLQSDFNRLNNLPNAFSLRLDPPSILLDARNSDDGKDVEVVVAQAPGIQNGPWNVLEVVSGNVNLRSLGVRPGDTIKCYLFPDSETRHRLNETGEVDPQMVNQEATDLVVAQVLDDNRVQIVGAVTPPRDLEVRIPEDDFAEVFGMNLNQMDQLREEGRVDAFGVRVPANRLPLDQLPNLITGVRWPAKIEVWRVNDDRVKAIDRALAGYAKRGEPPLGWEPAPDAEEVSRLVESFNRWLRSRDAIPQVEMPALVQSLPSTIRDDARLADYLSAEALNRPTFADYEGQLLQEAVWSRDIARWASGDAFDPLPRARRLFDWVVRNVTLTDSPRVLNHRPWHTLVYGQGGVEQRAWVFSSLCRQQRITSCVIEIPLGEDRSPWLWCGIVDHGQLYLFDPQLGLEIPAGESVATLEQVAGDDALLRSLDLPDAPYPVTAELAAKANVCVVADALALSARAAELEKQQSGELALALYQPVDSIAEQLNATPGVEQAILWEHPFSNLRRLVRLAASTTALSEKTRSAAAADFQPFAMIPRLWKARTLHFRGVVESEREARKQGVLHDPVNDHRDAAQLYLHPRVRPSEKTLKAAITSSERLALYRRSKVDATYWLALLKQDQGEPQQAQNWLENAVLDNAEAEHRASGTRYNLARALESQGKTEQAAELLKTSDSPQQHGNQLRADRLTSPDKPAEE